jgi:hypothetical protein
VTARNSFLILFFCLLLLPVFLFVLCHVITSSLLSHIFEADYMLLFIVYNSVKIQVKCDPVGVIDVHKD